MVEIAILENNYWGWVGGEQQVLCALLLEIQGKAGGGTGSSLAQRNGRQKAACPAKLGGRW